MTHVKSNSWTPTDLERRLRRRLAVSTVTGLGCSSSSTGRSTTQWQRAARRRPQRRLRGHAGPGRRPPRGRDRRRRLRPGHGRRVPGRQPGPRPPRPRPWCDKPGRFLLAVGDDWQSINRFAGADLSVMTDFEALVRPGPPAGADDHLPLPADDLRCRPGLRVEEPRASSASRCGRRTTIPARPSPSSEAIDPAGALASLPRRPVRRRRRRRRPGGPDGTVSVDVLGRYGFERDVLPRHAAGQPARHVPHRARLQGSRGRLHRDSRHDHRHLRVPEHDRRRPRARPGHARTRGFPARRGAPPLLRGPDPRPPGRSCSSPTRDGCPRSSPNFSRILT